MRIVGRLVGHLTFRRGLWGKRGMQFKRGCRKIALELSLDMGPPGQFDTDCSQ